MDDIPYKSNNPELFHQLKKTKTSNYLNERKNTIMENHEDSGNKHRFSGSSKRFSSISQISKTSNAKQKNISNKTKVEEKKNFIIQSKFKLDDLNLKIANNKIQDYLNNLIGTSQQQTEKSNINRQITKSPNKGSNIVTPNSNSKNVKINNRFSNPSFDLTCNLNTLKNSFYPNNNVNLNSNNNNLQMNKFFDEDSSNKIFPKSKLNNEKMVMNSNNNNVSISSNFNFNKESYINNDLNSKSSQLLNHIYEDNLNENNNNNNNFFTNNYKFDYKVSNKTNEFKHLKTKGVSSKNEIDIPKESQKDMKTKTYLPFFSNVNEKISRDELLLLNENFHFGNGDKNDLQFLENQNNFKISNKIPLNSFEKNLIENENNLKLVNDKKNFFVGLNINNADKDGLVKMITKKSESVLIERDSSDSFNIFQKKKQVKKCTNTNIQTKINIEERIKEDFSNESLDFAKVIKRNKNSNNISFEYDNLDREILNIHLRHSKNIPIFEIVNYKRKSKEFYQDFNINAKINHKLSGGNINQRINLQAILNSEPIINSINNQNIGDNKAIVKNLFANKNNPDISPNIDENNLNTLTSKNNLIIQVQENNSNNNIKNEASSNSDRNQLLNFQFTNNQNNNYSVSKRSNIYNKSKFKKPADFRLNLNKFVSKNNKKIYNESFESYSYSDNSSNGDRSIKAFHNIYDSYSGEEWDESKAVKPWYIISCSNKFRIMIDIISTLFVFYTIIFSPYQMAFDMDDLVETNSTLYFDILIDFFFMVDFLLNFITSFRDAKEDEIFSLSKITLNYLKSWFVFDFVSCIPFSFINLILTQQNLEEQKGLINTKGLGIGVSKLQRFAKIAKLYRFFKWSKILRLLKITKAESNGKFIFQNIDGLKSSINRFLKFLILFVFLIHFSTCIWIFIANSSILNGDSINWITHYSLMDQVNSDIYIGSLYFILVTVFSIGYGDLTAKSFNEKLFCLFLLTVGCLLFSYTLSSLSNIFSQIDKKKEIFNHKESILNEIRLEYKIDRSLENKIKNSLKHDLHSWNEDRLKLIDSLPSILKNQLYLKMYEKKIQNLIFFDNQSYEFITFTIGYLRSVKFARGDYIISIGEIIYEMYLTITGLISVELGNKYNKHEICLIPKNFHFGDILMYTNEQSKLSYKVKTHNSELFILSKINFAQIKLAFDKPTSKLLEHSYEFFMKIERSRILAVRYFEKFGNLDDFRSYLKKYIDKRNMKYKKQYTSLAIQESAISMERSEQENNLKKNVQESSSSDIFTLDSEKSQISLKQKNRDKNLIKNLSRSKKHSQLYENEEKNELRFNSNNKIRNLINNNNNIENFTSEKFSSNDFSANRDIDNSISLDGKMKSGINSSRNPHKIYMLNKNTSKKSLFNQNIKVKNINNNEEKITKLQKSKTAKLESNKKIQDINKKYLELKRKIKLENADEDDYDDLMNLSIEGNNINNVTLNYKGFNINSILFTPAEKKLLKFRCQNGMLNISSDSSFLNSDTEDKKKIKEALPTLIKSKTCRLYDKKHKTKTRDNKKSQIEKSKNESEMKLKKKRTLNKELSETKSGKDIPKTNFLVRALTATINKKYNEDINNYYENNYKAKEIQNKNLKRRSNLKNTLIKREENSWEKNIINHKESINLTGKKNFSSDHSDIFLNINNHLSNKNPSSTHNSNLSKNIIYINNLNINYSNQNNIEENSHMDMKNLINNTNFTFSKGQNINNFNNNNDKSPINFINKNNFFNSSSNVNIRRESILVSDSSYFDKKGNKSFKGHIADESLRRNFLNNYKKSPIINQKNALQAFSNSSKRKNEEIKRFSNSNKFTKQNITNSPQKILSDTPAFDTNKLFLAKNKLESPTNKPKVNTKIIDDTSAKKNNALKNMIKTKRRKTVHVNSNVEHHSSNNEKSPNIGFNTKYISSNLKSLMSKPTQLLLNNRLSPDGNFEKKFISKNKTIKKFPSESEKLYLNNNKKSDNNSHINQLLKSNNNLASHNLNKFNFLRKKSFLEIPILQENKMNQVQNKNSSENQFLKVLSEKITYDAFLYKNKEVLQNCIKDFLVDIQGESRFKHLMNRLNYLELLVKEYVKTSNNIVANRKRQSKKSFFKSLNSAL